MRSDATKPAAWFYHLNRIVIVLFLRIRHRIRVTVVGREHIPESGALLIASNHASYLDPPLISHAIKTRFVRYLARDTLFKKPIANWFFRKGGVTPMDRKKGDIGALKLSIKMLKEGSCVGIFPEGTRTENGQLQEAKGGIGFLINKSGVPVLPVFINGTYQAFPKGAGKIRSHPVTMYIGEPISPEQLVFQTESGKIDYEKIGNLVMERIANLNPSDQ